MINTGSFGETGVIPVRARRRNARKTLRSDQTTAVAASATVWKKSHWRDLRRLICRRCEAGISR